MSNIVLREEGSVYVRPDGQERAITTVDAQAYIQAVQRFNEYAAQLEQRGGQLQSAEFANIEQLNKIVHQMRVLALKSEDQAWEQAQLRVADARQDTAFWREGFFKVLESNERITTSVERSKSLEDVLSVWAVFGPLVAMFALLFLGVFASSVRQQPAPVTQPMGVVTWTN